MKKFFLMPALLFLAGTALSAAECPPPAAVSRPQTDRNPAMMCAQRQQRQRECAKMKKNGRKDCGIMPRVPMNEDEMAKFALLRLAVRDAHEDYRAEASAENLKALRSAVEKLVAAAQEFEIDRCEKALARAKAAVARKDQIVSRQLKHLTAKPSPEKMAPAPAPVR